MSGSVTSKIEASAALLSHTGSKYKPHDVTYKPPTSYTSHHKPDILGGLYVTLVPLRAGYIARSYAFSKL